MLQLPWSSRKSRRLEKMATHGNPAPGSNTKLCELQTHPCELWNIHEAMHTFVGGMWKCIHVLEHVTMHVCKEASLPTQKHYNTCNNKHRQKKNMPAETLMSRHWLCSHGLESRSERRFGSRSKTWLGSWFELRAFTCIVNAFPITIRICALRGNVLLLLHSPHAQIDPYAYAWLQRAFLKCTRTNHVPKELCVHMS